MRNGSQPQAQRTGCSAGLGTQMSMLMAFFEVVALCWDMLRDVEMVETFKSVRTACLSLRTLLDITFGYFWCFLVRKLFKGFVASMDCRNHHWRRRLSMGVNSEPPPTREQRHEQLRVTKASLQEIHCSPDHTALTIPLTGGNGVNPICGGAAGCNNSNPRRDSAQGTPEEISNENWQNF